MLLETVVVSAEARLRYSSSSAFKLNVVADRLRQVGFFLRHFQRSGEIPPALRTAILWQPKSWAKFRKILLAPPGERIVMPGLCGHDV